MSLGATEQPGANPAVKPSGTVTFELVLPEVPVDTVVLPDDLPLPLITTAPDEVLDEDVSTTVSSDSPSPLVPLVLIFPVLPDFS